MTGDLFNRICSGANWRCFRRDNAGVTAVEFAVVAPVFLTMLMGILDLGHMMYGKSVLNGAVQEAARSASLETGDTTAADELIAARIAPILSNATVETTRTSYFDFADIERAEDWNDADNNGVCNDGESFTDENGNGAWDADIGVDGNGGANDVVIYTVSVTYEPIFRIPFTPEQWGERTIETTAIRKNQPYANQEGYGSEARTCD